MIQMHSYFLRKYFTEDDTWNRIQYFFEYGYYIPEMKKIYASIAKNGSMSLQRVKRFYKDEIQLINPTHEAWSDSENEVIFFLRHPLERFRSAMQFEYEQFEKNPLKKPRPYFLYFEQRVGVCLESNSNHHYLPQSVYLLYDEKDLSLFKDGDESPMIIGRGYSWARNNGGYNEILKKVSPCTDSRIKYYHLSQITDIISLTVEQSKMINLNQSNPNPEVDKWIEANMDRIASVYSEDINIYERLTGRKD